VVATVIRSASFDPLDHASYEVHSDHSA